MYFLLPSILFQPDNGNTKKVLDQNKFEKAWDWSIGLVKDWRKKYNNINVNVKHEGVVGYYSSFVSTGNAFCSKDMYWDLH